MSPAIRRPGVELQDRDVALLRGLFEARVMTLAHAATFYFVDRIEAATKRVQKLKSAGILGERPRRVYEPSVLFLKHKAFRLLVERGALDDYPNIGWAKIEKRAHVSDLTLRHELDVMDVRAALWRAVAADRSYAIEEFSTWPLLSQFRASPGHGLREVVLRPDGFIRIAEQEVDGGVSEHTFFLELDRSTEVQATLAAKAACYGDFYRRGGLAARNGRPRDEYKSFPFRVLVVCRNAERRNNAAERMLQNRPPVLTQVWLTTFAEVIADPLGPIWVQPLDYRNAVSYTPYDLNARASDEVVYRRHVRRDEHVERTALKRSLLAGPF